MTDCGGQGVQPARGEGKAFGTFGELLQGVLPGSNLDFLVTLPITRYSRVLFLSDPRGEDLRVDPPHKLKTRMLAGRLLSHLQLPPGGTLLVRSQLPEGKGLASSSADLVATARAIEDAFQVEIPLSVLCNFLREIEPTDGVMYPGVVSFYHRAVQVGEFLGVLPPLTVVSTDEGGEVDTIEFNRMTKPYTAAEKLEYHRLLHQLTAAVADQDVPAIGRVATRSALLNEAIRPKATLQQTISLAETLAAPGVVVAHSGTCLGVLLSPRDSRYRRQLRCAWKHLRALTGNATVYHSWR